MMKGSVNQEGMTILNVNNKCCKINEAKTQRLQEEVEKSTITGIYFSAHSLTDRINRISKDIVDI